jgi:hypothetical protein
MLSRRTEGLAPTAEAVGYATDPKRNLSPTPPTLITDVDGVGDRPRSMSVALATERATCRWRSRQPGRAPRRSQTPLLGRGRGPEPRIGCCWRIGCCLR